MSSPKCEPDKAVVTDEQRAAFVARAMQASKQMQAATAMQRTKQEQLRTDLTKLTVSKGMQVLYLFM